MLLGQLVAISVATNLFFLAILLSAQPSLPQDANEKQATKQHQPRPDNALFPLSLVGIPLGAFLLIRETPESVNSPYFLQNLLLFHGATFLTVIAAYISSSSISSTSPRTAYAFLALFASFVRLETVKNLIIPDTPRGTLFSSMKGFASDPIGTLDIVMRATEELERHGWKLLHSHPAQSSIGWDVVWTTVSVLAWALVQPFLSKQRMKTWVILATLATSLVLTPFVGVGVTALLVFAVYDSSD